MPVVTWKAPVVAEVMANAMKRDQDPELYDAAAAYLDVVIEQVNADAPHYGVMVGSFCDGYKAARVAAAN